jgi:hypothetical protein
MYQHIIDHVILRIIKLIIKRTLPNQENQINAYLHTYKASYTVLFKLQQG